MVFGKWFCHACKKWIIVGTVAPRGVMNRHLATRRHHKNEAAQVAEAERTNPEKQGA